MKEFGNGKYDNNNELVSILDNLKARGVIKSEDYRKVTDYLSSKLLSEEEDVESKMLELFAEIYKRRIQRKSRGV